MLSPLTRLRVREETTLRLTSEAFDDGQPIPVRFSCRGTDISPPLRFEDVPHGAQALAMVVDDPDAPRGTWTHWTWWDVPASLGGLGQGADIAALGGVEGTTSARAIGYHGPCPPAGTHRYMFQLYALDRRLGLPRGAEVTAVRLALQGRGQAEARLTGTFKH